MKEILLKLGLTEKESEVFIAITQRGRISPRELVNSTKINRATIYAVAQSLESKGLIKKDVGSETMRFLSLSPAEIKNLISEEKRKSKEKENVLSNLISELEKQGTKAPMNTPKMRFVEEKNVRAFLFKEYPVWYESAHATDSTWWGFQDHAFIEVYEDWIHQVWKDYPTGHVKLLSNKSSVEEGLKEKYKNREIRFYKDSLSFTATTWAVGEFVIMVMVSTKPNYLIEIHDTVLTHNMRELFKSIWHNTF